MTSDAARYPNPHPVPAASRLISKLRNHGLADLVDAQTAVDIDVAARFTIGEHLCRCDQGEGPSHVVGDNCPTGHRFHPSRE